MEDEDLMFMDEKFAAKGNKTPATDRKSIKMGLSLSSKKILDTRAQDQLIDLR